MNSHHEVRSKYIEDFKESVYGFDWKELNNKEIYFNPENQFVSGILFPLEKLILSGS